MILFIEKTWPLWWILASVVIARWFYGIASDPRIETIDSSFQPYEEEAIERSPRSLTPSRGFGL